MLAYASELRVVLWGLCSDLFSLHMKAFLVGLVDEFLGVLICFLRAEIIKMLVTY